MINVSSKAKKETRKEKEILIRKLISLLPGNALNDEDQPKVTYSWEKKKKNLPQKLRTIKRSPWPFLKVRLQSKDQHVKLNAATLSELLVARCFVFSDDRVDSQKLAFKLPLRKDLLRAKSSSCVLQQTKNQGHGYPSQTSHPGMWTLLQSSSSSALTLPSTHSLLTRSMSIIQ